MREYGVFNQEGLIEDGFCSFAAAEAAADEYPVGEFVFADQILAGDRAASVVLVEAEGF